MTKKIATIGSLTIDLFVQPQESSIISQVSEHTKKEFLALEHGGKIVADSIKMHLGGGASNTAVSFARQGFESHIWGAIGDDDNADIIRKKLNKEGSISLENIQVLPNLSTGFSIIINSFDGERTVLFNSRANKSFNNISCKTLEERGYDGVHLCHVSGENTDKIFASFEEFFEKNPEKIFSWNPGKERIEKGIDGNASLLKNTNFLYVNTEEAEEFTGLFAKRKISYGEEVRRKFLNISDSSRHLPQYAKDVSHIAQKFLDGGVKIVIITDGRRGAQIFSSDESLFIPAFGEKRVDTLGAGDSFASTFTAKIMQGKSLIEAAKYASMQAASVVSMKGAQDGLLAGDELQKQYKKYF